MQQFQEIVERQNILDRLRSILLLPAPSILMLLQKYCCYNWHTTAILLLLLTYILKWNTTAKIANLLTQMAYYGHYWHTAATNWILLQQLAYNWFYWQTNVPTSKAQNAPYRVSASNVSDRRQQSTLSYHATPLIPTYFQHLILNQRLQTYEGNR